MPVGLSIWTMEQIWLFCIYLPWEWAQWSPWSVPFSSALPLKVVALEQNLMSLAGDTGEWKERRPMYQRSGVCGLWAVQVWLESKINKHFMIFSRVLFCAWSYHLFGTWFVCLPWTHMYTIGVTTSFIVEGLVMTQGHHQDSPWLFHDSCGRGDSNSKLKTCTDRYECTLATFLQPLY